MTFETSNGICHSNVSSLLIALLGGDKFYTTVQLNGARGWIVTNAGRVMAANYTAKRPYLLDRVEQRAIFVPVSYGICRMMLKHPGRNCNAYAVFKDGSMRLLVSKADLIRHAELGGQVATDFPLDLSALGYAFDWINGQFACWPLYSTVISRLVNQVVQLKHQQVVKFHEENTMQDLSAILFGEELFAVSVNFKGSTKAYTYKSTKEYNQGDKVIVDSPQDGLVVVTVTSCRRGLSTDVAGFDSYKWLVGSVDMAEYNRLVEAERDFVRKAKQEAQRREAIKKLADLGVSAEEYRKAILGE